MTTRRDRQRWAARGTTTQRGYGAAHQRERERRLRQYKPGDICAHGGEPLPYPRETARHHLHLPHNAARTGYLPGLSCRYHNQLDGAIRGNLARWPRAAARQASRSW